MTSLSRRDSTRAPLCRAACPFLAIGGEDDELTALETTFALTDDISAPKELMLLQGERHNMDVLGDDLPGVVLGE